MTEQTFWDTSSSLSISFPSLRITRSKWQQGKLYITQAQPRPYTPHTPYFQNMQALTTSISIQIMQSSNTATQKWIFELHWTHHMPAAWVFRSSFCVPTSHRYICTKWDDLWEWLLCQDWHFQGKVHFEIPAAMWHRGPGDEQPCFSGGGTSQTWESEGSDLIGESTLNIF